MPRNTTALLQPPRVFELTGVAALTLGALDAAGAFAVRLRRHAGVHDAYHALRADLGGAILLEPELLVIADIIGTVAIEPTLQNLGELAVIVAIPTFPSFALELEVSGRRPWQHSQATTRNACRPVCRGLICGNLRALGYKPGRAALPCVPERP